MIQYLLQRIFLGIGLCAVPAALLAQVDMIEEPLERKRMQPKRRCGIILDLIGTAITSYEIL